MCQVMIWFDLILFDFSSLFTPHNIERDGATSKRSGNHTGFISSPQGGVCATAGWCKHPVQPIKSWPTATSGDLSLIPLTLFSQILMKQGGRGIFLFHWWGSLIYHLSPDQRPTVGRKLPGKVSLYIERNLLVSTGGLQASPQHHRYGCYLDSSLRWKPGLWRADSEWHVRPASWCHPKGYRGKFRGGKPKVFL